MCMPLARAQAFFRYFHRDNLGFLFGPAIPGHEGRKLLDNTAVLESSAGRIEDSLFWFIQQHADIYDTFPRTGNLRKYCVDTLTTA